MSVAAAFFDLDRTIIDGSSGPAFAAALRRRGLLQTQPHPLESVLFAVYELVGETEGAMAMSREAARLCDGWPAVEVEAAGREAAAELIGLVHGDVASELAGHHRRGRPLVLATTSPDELARPLAAALGFDDVIATHYGRCGEHLDGTVDGAFIWGPRKRAAVEAWAVDHCVDLAVSHAYSDSYFDLPLLEAVGHPVAVNPDLRLAALARRRGWPIRSLAEPADSAR